MLTELMVEARMADYERMAAGYELRRDARLLFRKAAVEPVTTPAAALEPRTGTQRQTAP